MGETLPLAVILCARPYQTVRLRSRPAGAGRAPAGPVPRPLRGVHRRRRCPGTAGVRPRLRGQCRGQQGRTVQSVVVDRDGACGRQTPRLGTVEVRVGAVLGVDPGGCPVRGGTPGEGYAFGYVASPGSALSTGCSTLGGPAEIESVVAAIDWLNGRRTGCDQREGGDPVDAPWTDGTTGLFGESYRGALANAAAADCS